MPRFDLNLFLDQLAAYMATNAAGGPLERAGTPRAVWTFNAVEASATDPYSVLAPVGLGEHPRMPVVIVPVLVTTTAKKADQGRARAQVLFDTLVESDGRTKHMVDLGGGVRLLGVQQLRPPQPIAPGEGERERVVYSFKTR